MKLLQKDMNFMNCIHSKILSLNICLLILNTIFVLEFRLINMFMNKQEIKKKVWIRPEVHILNIKKDTFSGASYGNEKAGKSKIPGP